MSETLVRRAAVVTGSVGTWAAMFAVLVGCASARATPSRMHALPEPKSELQSFTRVLVAGFIPRGTRDVALNQETARILRTQLRTKTLFQAIEAQPWELPDASREWTSRTQALLIDANVSSSVRATGSSEDTDDDAVFHNVPFWKALGEEHSGPLIVTGTVIFKPLAPTYEELPMPRGTARRWLKRFALTLRLVFISGRTGEMIDSVTLPQITMRAKETRESALGLYFQSMDRMMPSILFMFGEEYRPGLVTMASSVNASNGKRIPVG